MSTRSFTSRAALALAAASTATLAVLLGSTPDRASGAQATSPGKNLFGRAWIAKEIVKDGERIPLEKGTRLVFRLHRGGKHDGASWRAGCNHFGARVEVTPKRLRFKGIYQTDMGCRPVLHRQDNRIARFFASDPRWKREGRRLILRSDDDAIRLTRRPRAVASP